MAASLSIVRTLIRSSDEDLWQTGHIHPDCPCPPIAVLQPPATGADFFFFSFFSAHSGECHWTLAVTVSLSSVRRLRMFVASRCLSPMPACHRLMHVSSLCLSPPHICHHRTLYHWCISALDICCRWTILTCHFTVPRKFFGTVGIARDLNRGPQDLQPGALPTELPQPRFFFSFFFLSAHSGECHWTLAVTVSLSSVRRLRMFVASRCLSPMPACHRLMHVSSLCLSPPHICHHRTLYHWCISALDICCRWTILTCHFTVPRKFFGTVGIARDLNRGPQDLQPGALPLSHHNPC